MRAQYRSVSDWQGLHQLPNRLPPRAVPMCTFCGRLLGKHAVARCFERVDWMQRPLERAVTDLVNSQRSIASGRIQRPSLHPLHPGHCQPGSDWLDPAIAYIADGRQRNEKVDPARDAAAWDVH